MPAGSSLRLALLVGVARRLVERAPLGRRAGAVTFLVDGDVAAVLVALAVAVAADVVGADDADDLRGSGRLGRRRGLRRLRVLRFRGHDDRQSAHGHRRQDQKGRDRRRQNLIPPPALAHHAYLSPVPVLNSTTLSSRRTRPFASRRRSAARHAPPSGQASTPSSVASCRAAEARSSSSTATAQPWLFRIACSIRKSPRLAVTRSPDATVRGSLQASALSAP